MATLQAVIIRTREMNRQELALVQSRADIEQPQVKYRATLVKAPKSSM